MGIARSRSRTHPLHPIAVGTLLMVAGRDGGLAAHNTGPSHSSRSHSGSGSFIPQNGGGDHDTDNSGGPSDSDGNL
jgi:hypothetical protein